MIVAAQKGLDEIKKLVADAGKILVVGVTYKKDIKDLRQSPSLDMIGHLQPPAPG
jgi:UDP-N-acetyl-D-mannosaminuronate dehydrogenase